MQIFQVPMFPTDETCSSFTQDALEQQTAATSHLKSRRKLFFSFFLLTLLRIRFTVLNFFVGAAKVIIATLQYSHLCIKVKQWFLAQVGWCGCRVGLSGMNGSEAKYTCFPLHSIHLCILSLWPPTPSQVQGKLGGRSQVEMKMKFSLVYEGEKETWPHTKGSTLTRQPTPLQDIFYSFIPLRTVLSTALGIAVVGCIGISVTTPNKL